MTYLSHSDVLELRGQREDPEELDLAEGGLQLLVVHLDGVVCDVEVTGDATQVGDLYGDNLFSFN